MVGHAWAFPADKFTFSVWFNWTIRQSGARSVRTFLSQHGISPVGNQWALGTSSPSPSGVRRLAEALEIGEAEILTHMGLVQFTSADEWQTARKNGTRDRAHIKSKNRYNSDPRYRKRVHLAQSVINERKRRNTDRSKMIAHALSLSGEAKAMYVQAKQTEYSQRRRSRIANRSGTFTRQEFWDLCRTFIYCCAYCGIKQTRKDKRTLLQADHVIPLASDHPASSNGIENILPCCRTCNGSKNSRNLIEWARDFGRSLSSHAIAKYEYLIGVDNAAS